MVGLGGLEPPTSPLSVLRSSVERNDRRANHKQPIFLTVLYRLRNCVLKESRRRNQTSACEDQTPQNWAFSSEKGHHMTMVHRLRRRR
jgi:hypothetical protein